ncbi:Hsp20/alpha crystallin family protein [Haladaptatus sp. NG-WS-4]
MERYTPFEEMDRLLEQMRTRMSGLDDPRSQLRRGTPIDLAERDGKFVLVADLPGFEKEEIDLSIHDGVVIIAAKHEVTGDEFARSRTVSERVTLPKTVEKEEITATYRNGVLEVFFPIVEDGASEDRIEITD